MMGRLRCGLRWGRRYSLALSLPLWMPTNVPGALRHLLEEDRLSAATALLHGVDGTHRLPDQLLLLYLSKVCSHGHHLGSIMVYHQLISPTSHPLSLTAPYPSSIPFLINPQSLIHLATIFANHGDYERVNGLMIYFKRYYSYVFQRDCHKQLRILLVEALAKANLVDRAVASMNTLLKYHQASAAGGVRLNRWIHTVGAQGVRNRRALIQEGSELDELDDDIVRADSLGEESWPLHLPIYSYNVYQVVGVSTPLIHGRLEVADFPQFIGMLAKYLADSPEASNPHQLVTKMLGMVEGAHPSFVNYVIAAVAPSHPSEAFQLIRRLYLRDRTLLPPTMTTLATNMPLEYLDQITELWRSAAPHTALPADFHQQVIKKYLFEDRVDEAVAYSNQLSAPTRIPKTLYYHYPQLKTAANILCI